MPGLRLYPNYHGYKLDDPDFAKLLGMAAAKGLLVELALIMEDDRMMHPLLRVPVTDPAPLAGVVKQAPGLRLVIVNGLRTVREKALVDTVNAGNVSVEIAMLDAVNGVADLVSSLPPGPGAFRVVCAAFLFRGGRAQGPGVPAHGRAGPGDPLRKRPTAAA